MAMSGDLAWMDEMAGTYGLMHNSGISVIGCGSVPPCTQHTGSFSTLRDI